MTIIAAVVVHWDKVFTWKSSDGVGFGVAPPRRKTTPKSVVAMIFAGAS